jgi:hypothetical protein
VSPCIFTLCCWLSLRIFSLSCALSLSLSLSLPSCICMCMCVHVHYIWRIFSLESISWVRTDSSQFLKLKKEIIK